MLDEKQRAEAASALRQAEATREAISPLSETWPNIDLQDAYAIQLDNIGRRLTDGAVVQGYKVGLTSKPMQEMLGVDEPDYGHLLDDMSGSNGAELQASRYISPRIEIEIGFVLGGPLPGKGCSVDDVLRATDFVTPCFEIIDSWIRYWKITLADTIVDNVSSAAVVRGDIRMSPEDLDLRTVGAVLKRNDEVLDSGSSSAVLGNPAAAVAWLANKLSGLGVSLKANDLILSGSFTRAYDVGAGDHIRADFEGLGSIDVRFI